LPEPSPSGNTALRLTARDTRTLLLWLLVGILGASVAYRYFFLAFPEASVNFQVTRQQALDKARTFVAAQGFSLEGYRSAIVFNVDDNEKTYLERELGVEDANRLMSSEVNVWSWDARFFKPLQKEEFRVGVDPAGRVVSFRHTLDEAATGARIEREQAIAAAETFLRDTLHTPLGGYTYLPSEANSTVRPARDDWSLTWERTGFRAKDAPYRLIVSLAGDRVSGYEETLQVPEAWQRDYDRMRSRNNLIAAIAAIAYAILLGAALSVAFGLGRRGQAPWWGGARFGLFVAGLYFAMTMNQWPLALSDYNTNGSFSSFILNQTGLALGTALLMSLLMVIALVPGEPLFRTAQPDRLRLGALVRLPALRTKEFFISGSVGVCLAAVHIGYVVVFYVVGRRFGVWAPQDLQYSDTLSTALPWIYPLTIGIYAATSEEFLFRLFAIPWLRRLTNSKAISVILPALAWGFLHANYPQQPAYIRGVEVGAFGIVAGLVMLRWGILATLIWHYTVDAFLVGLSLMRSADLYSRISGTVVGLAGLIVVGVAGVLYLKNGAFVAQAEMLNGAQPLVDELPAQAEPVSTETVAAPSAVYEPLSARAIGIMLVCALLALALVIGAKIPAIGDFVRFSMNGRQAEIRAADALRQQGVSSDGYRRVATVQYRFDPLVNEYLRRSIGIAAANKVYQSEAPAAYWTVRFFRDSQKEEYLVVLRSDGGLHSVHHVLPEAAPGANLTKEAAQQRAETYLANFTKLDLSQWRLVDSHSDKLPARTDHVFTWEQKTSVASLGGDEGAHVRSELQVQGDEASGYRVYIHLPEDWLRKQNEETVATTAHANGLFGLIGAFIAAVLVAFLSNLKSPTAAAIPWRKSAPWALLVVAAFLVWAVTNIPQYLARYPTENSLSTYLGMTGVSFVLGSAALYGVSLVLFGLAWFFLVRTYGSDALPRRRALPALYYRDALIAGCCGFAVLAGIVQFRSVLARIWQAPRYAFSALSPTIVDAGPPALQALASALMFSLLGVAVVALAAGFAASYFRAAWKQIIVLGLLALLLSPRWGSAGDLLQNLLVFWAALLLVRWAICRVFRFNLLAYALTIALVVLVNAAAELLHQPDSYFRMQGAILVAAAAALLVWLLARWRRSAPQMPAGVPAPPSLA
jgi:membrane protease YdiL (CAAX protease family)